jgi:hypothetical protein
MYPPYDFYSFSYLPLYDSYYNQDIILKEILNETKHVDLSDWLKKYNPDISISDGLQTLRGVRLFFKRLRIETQNVYLGMAKDFISTNHEDVICINGHDILY